MIIFLKIAFTDFFKALFKIVEKINKNYSP